MTGAVATADPAAAAAGNASLLSATGEPPAADPNPTEPTQPPTEPTADPPKGPETDPAEPEKEGEGEDAKAGAPEKYEFVPPEGVTLDPAAVEEFTPVARELGLTQEQAQRVVNLYAGLQQRQADALAEQSRQWVEQVMADKDLGGARWDANRALVAQARDRFATPALVELMETTGLGNHPEVIRLFAAVGKAIADDGHVIGGQPIQSGDFATDFYGRMPKLEGAR